MTSGSWDVLRCRWASSFCCFKEPYCLLVLLDCLTLNALWSVNTRPSTRCHIPQDCPEDTSGLSMLWHVYRLCTIFIHFVFQYHVYQVSAHHKAERPPISSPTFCFHEPTILNPDYLTSLFLDLLTWAYDQNFLSWLVHPNSLLAQDGTTWMSLPWCCGNTSCLVLFSPHNTTQVFGLFCFVKKVHGALKPFYVFIKFSAAVWSCMYALRVTCNLFHSHSPFQPVWNRWKKCAGELLKEILSLKLPTGWCLHWWLPCSTQLSTILIWM
jgi:hypothetical protein